MVGFDCQILADSWSPGGVRLVTFEATFPRFILAEWNTHRVLSRNSASSRAIPIHKQIARARNAPFVPLGFGSAQAGMSAGADLDGFKHFIARQVWLKSRFPAIAAAWGLGKLNVHKAFANRLLEPWMWHTVITTSSRWDNFFALRTDENAQPEFQMIAGMMQDALAKNKWTHKQVGQWHLPLVFPEDRKVVPEHQLPMLSAGRCARVSFDRHHDTEPVEKSLSRAEMLTSNGHWSPTEHQAQVLPGESAVTRSLTGNFHGDWAQHRKMFLHEDNFKRLKEAKA